MGRDIFYKLSFASVYNLVTNEHIEKSTERAHLPDIDSAGAIFAEMLQKDWSCRKKDLVWNGVENGHRNRR